MKKSTVIQFAAIIMLMAALTNCSSAVTQKDVSDDTPKAVILASEKEFDEKVVAAVVKPVTVVLAFEDIHFTLDKYVLKPEAQTILKRNMQILQNNPRAKIVIAGYTSASGTQKHNQTLSEKRAGAVMDYLIKNGVVAPGRLYMIGYGEKNPAVREVAPKNIYSKAAKANMRVLFEIFVN